MPDTDTERIKKSSLITIALLHYLIRKRDGSVGFTSVTNLDVHDIARVTRTFGLNAFYIVTPVDSQKKHASRICSHWTKGFGATYNPFRKDAIDTVKLADTLEDVVDTVHRQHGRKPTVIGTAATKISNKIIDYPDVYDRILSADRPVVLVFGTGWGLHPEAVQKCDMFLKPITGTGDYNHLSVRSAVTITIDRIISVR